ncbi:unnamed protein product, partial [Mesorhabditis belari]|uniref:Uncharacterized protein n=1 Tax=Mesorhabditis belari TaxID=2138241 RepID=A0AAF3J1D5_9BILA
MGFLEIFYILCTVFVLFINVIPVFFFFTYSAVAILICGDNKSAMCFYDQRMIGESETWLIVFFSIAAIASFIYLVLLILSICGAVKRKGHLLIPVILLSIIELGCLFSTNLQRAQNVGIFADSTWSAIVSAFQIFELLRVVLALFVYFESKFAEQHVQVLPSRLPEEEKYVKEITAPCQQLNYAYNEQQQFYA